MHRRVLLVAAALFTIVGLALRIIAARGDLWLDEVWTYDLLSGIGSPDQIFWKIASDNNHYLNSLWLYAVGPDAPVLVQRGLSILLGTASIPVAGWLLRRDGTVAAIVGMAIVALSYPMVHFGSEARGYAGLILCTLLAFCLTRAAIAGKRHPVWLGVVLVTGLLFQPIMLFTIAVIGAWFLWESRRESGLRRAIGETLGFFLPSARLILLALLLIAFAAWRSGGFRVEGTSAFGFDRFATGYGGLLRLLLGLPEAVPNILVLASCLAASLVLIWRRRIDPIAALAVLGLWVLPAAMAAAHLPNLHFGRYFLTPGLVGIVAVSLGAAALWRRGTWPRIVLAVACLAVLAGNAIEIGRFLETGRGRYGEALTYMAASGPVSVGSDQDLRNAALVNFHARRLGLPIVYVPLADLCRARPAWMIASAYSAPADRIGVGETCAIVYRADRTYPVWGLSGGPWTLYRRAD